MARRMEPGGDPGFGRIGGDGGESGVCARNRGWNWRGEFVQFLDADDVLKPESWSGRFRQPARGAGGDCVL